MSSIFILTSKFNLQRMIIVIKHIAIEGPGSIEKFFRNTAWDLEIIDLGDGQALPTSLEKVNAVISLGGPMNAYEEEKYPFLKNEDAFLKIALQEEVPILGICLGAQLVAKACGAKVKKAAEPEIGWQEVTLTRQGTEDILLRGVAHAINVFEWHEDTFAVPEGGVLLATSGSCVNQACRFGANAYGLQFHIEVTPEMVASWIQAYAQEGRVDLSEAAGIMVETYRRKEEFERQAESIYLNFARVIELSQKNTVAC